MAQMCQTTTFTYDAAGNRIQRVMTIQTCAQREVNDTLLEAINRIEKDQDIPDTEEIVSGSNEMETGVGKGDGTTVPDDTPVIDACLYPNPATEKVTLAVKLPASVQSPESQVYLYDIKGKRIDSFRTEQSEIAFNVESLAPGMYFVKVVNGDLSQVFQLIKK